jgi:phage tail sheath protein FI
MPEYLSPGVYVEEVSFRSKSIEGVSTTTTGFVGPARFGPTDILPDIITSLGDFERVYGDGQQLTFGTSTVVDNFLWHAVRAFFEEGGKRLYISRVFKVKGGDTANGIASAKVPTTGTDAQKISIAARFPGSGGNVRVKFALKIGQNVLTSAGLKSVGDGDMVWVGQGSAGNAPTTGDLEKVVYDTVSQTYKIKTYADVDTAVLAADKDEVRVVTLTVTITLADKDNSQIILAGLACEPSHTKGGQGDSLTAYFAATPANSSLARTLPLVMTAGSSLTSGLLVAQALFGATATIAANAGITLPANFTYETADTLLSGGNDGDRPTSTEYVGTANDTTAVKTGLKAFEDLEDISIVAAPGSTFGFGGSTNQQADSTAIINALITHATNMRYRIAVLDSGNAQAIANVRAMRAQFDSKYAALYYPWIRVIDPITRKEIYLPPSGFVAGIYARNDIERGVIKAPANEVVNTALGFEINLNKSQQDVLNPEGVNCFRFFEGRGNRLWGARTISSDPEWKYVNLRRYFAYVERSIDRGTQWAVFEPNGEQLWANVRSTVYDFLLNEWQKGALLGEKPEKAFFVRCDRSTMTQNDLDNGRLVCLVGIAPLKPAEFVIFKIGQWTADSKV